MLEGRLPEFFENSYQILRTVATSATGDTAEVTDIEIDTVQQLLVVARRKEALVVGSISFTRTRAGFALKH